VVQPAAGPEVVALALEASARLAHRGAASTDLSADGAGVLTQIPRRLCILAASRLGIPVPADAQIGVGMLFLPAEAEAQAQRVSHGVAQELAALWPSGR
jgi:glutamate synthase domain-containing protein 1